MLEFKTVMIRKPADSTNVIIGQSHFIKTVEDIYEAVAGAVPGAQFGLAFAEASGARKIRCEGTDEELKRYAADNVQSLGAGHCFVLMLGNVFPINLLNVLRSVPEVCGIYCASANPLEVIIAETPAGRGIMGVIDGAPPAGIEDAADVAWRREFLRTIGYKR